jgi:hypothetical protein
MSAGKPGATTPTSTVGTVPVDQSGGTPVASAGSAGSEAIVGANTSASSGGMAGGAGQAEAAFSRTADINLPQTNLVNNLNLMMNYKPYPDVFNPLIAGNNNLINELSGLKTDIEDALREITGKDGVMDKVGQMDRLMMNLQSKILAAGNQMTAAEIAAIQPVAPISRAELADCMRAKLQGQRDMREAIAELNQALMKTNILLVNARDRDRRLQRMKNELLPSRETAMNMAASMKDEINADVRAVGVTRGSFEASKERFSEALGNFTRPIDAFLKRVKQVIIAFIAAKLTLNGAKQETIDAYKEAAAFLDKLK